MSQFTVDQVSCAATIRGNVVLIAAVVLAIAGCAGRSVSPDDVVYTTIFEAPENNQDPIVCKRVTHGGTRISRKVCKPRSAWDEWSRESRDWLEEEGYRNRVPVIRL